MGPVYSRDFDEDAFGIGWRRTIWNVEQLDNWFAGERRTFDFTDRLAEITCPALVMSGAHDWICTPEQGRIISEPTTRSLPTAAIRWGRMSRRRSWRRCGDCWSACSGCRGAERKGSRVDPKAACQNVGFRCYRPVREQIDHVVVLVRW
jgi:hypothetical protein